AKQRDRVIPELLRIRRPTSHQDTLHRTIKIHCQSVHTTGVASAKFVTTPEYAPRLRTRRRVEQTLALGAAERGWDREVERHRCTSQRIEKLLADLNEPFED
ncbi:hypothetical protein, partial [Streptomyces sp. CJ_13]|uniref:hypothetical protein n=1 Tax=Streptomyces sp. CJ_13 TaxID=2724943 RepID=UPI001BDD08D4